MGDLNITGTDSLHFDLKAYLKDGTVYEAWNVCLNLSDSSQSRFLRMRNSEKNREMCITFWPSLAKIVGGEYIINERIESPVYDADDFYDLPEDQRAAAAKAANENMVERIVLTKCPEMTASRFLV